MKDTENNSKFPIISYNINSKSNLLIAFGYVSNEIFKFLYIDKFHELTITINNIVTMKGWNLDYMIKDIIKVPNCNKCGDNCRCDHNEKSI